MFCGVFFWARTSNYSLLSVKAECHGSLHSGSLKEGWGSRKMSPFCVDWTFTTFLGHQSSTEVLGEVRGGCSTSWKGEPHWDPPIPCPRTGTGEERSLCVSEKSLSYSNPTNTVLSQPRGLFMQRDESQIVLNFSFAAVTSRRDVFILGWGSSVQVGEL